MYTARSLSLARSKSLHTVRPPTADMIPAWCVSLCAVLCCPTTFVGPFVVTPEILILQRVAPLKLLDFNTYLFFLFLQRIYSEGAHQFLTRPSVPSVPFCANFCLHSIQRSILWPFPPAASPACCTSVVSPVQFLLFILTFHVFIIFKIARCSQMPVTLITAGPAAPPKTIPSNPVHPRRALFR